MNYDRGPAAHSLWLIPEAADGQRLDALIAELAPLFATAAFRAHVTVQGDLATPLPELREIAAALARSCPRLDWPPAGVAASMHYFRSLYLELPPHAEFARLQTEAAALSGTALGLSPFPHLSLAYGEAADPALKPALLRRYAQWFRVRPGLRCDRLAIARSSKDLPIAQWTLIESFALGRPD